MYRRTQLVPDRINKGNKRLQRTQSRHAVTDQPCCNLGIATEVALDQDPLKFRQLAPTRFQIVTLSYYLAIAMTSGGTNRPHRAVGNAVTPDLFFKLDRGHKKGTSFFSTFKNCSGRNHERKNDQAREIPLPPKPVTDSLYSTWDVGLSDGHRPDPPTASTLWTVPAGAGTSAFIPGGNTATYTYIDTRTPSLSRCVTSASRAF